MMVPEREFHESLRLTGGWVMGDAEWGADSEALAAGDSSRMRWDVLWHVADWCHLVGAEFDLEAAIEVVRGGRGINRLCPNPYDPTGRTGVYDASTVCLEACFGRRLERTDNLRALDGLRGLAGVPLPPAEWCDAERERRLAIANARAASERDGLAGLVLPARDPEFVPGTHQHWLIADFWRHGGGARSIDGIRLGEAPTPHRGTYDPTRLHRVTDNMGLGPGIVRPTRDEAAAGRAHRWAVVPVSWDRSNGISNAKALGVSLFVGPEEARAEFARAQQRARESMGRLCELYPDGGVAYAARWSLGAVMCEQEWVTGHVTFPSGDQMDAPEGWWVLDALDEGFSDDPGKDPGLTREYYDGNDREVRRTGVYSFYVPASLPVGTFLASMAGEGLVEPEQAPHWEALRARFREPGAIASAVVALDGAVPEPGVRDFEIER